jgi:hypothetical protein
MGPEQRRRQQGSSRGGLNRPVRPQGGRQTKPQSPGLYMYNGLCWCQNDVEEEDGSEERESAGED